MIGILQLHNKLQRIGVPTRHSWMMRVVQGRVLSQAVVK